LCVDQRLSAVAAVDVLVFAIVFITYFLLLFTAIEFSLGGCIPYTSTDNTNKNKYT
jgi:hypothetical protein